MPYTIAGGILGSITDIDGKNEIEPDHLAEAIQYRSLDRENWAG